MLVHFFNKGVDNWCGDKTYKNLAKSEGLHTLRTRQDF